MEGRKEEGEEGRKETGLRVCFIFLQHHGAGGNGLVPPMRLKLEGGMIVKWQ
jgi:hypothetical protein